MDENLAEHDSKIKRMVPRSDLNPFLFPKELLNRIKLVVNVTTLESNSNNLRTSNLHTGNGEI